MRARLELSSSDPANAETCVEAVTGRAVKWRAGEGRRERRRKISSGGAAIAPTTGGVQTSSTSTAETQESTVRPSGSCDIFRRTRRFQMTPMETARDRDDRSTPVSDPFNSREARGCRQTCEDAEPSRLAQLCEVPGDCSGFQRIAPGERVPSTHARDGADGAGRRAMPGADPVAAAPKTSRLPRSSKVAARFAPTRDPENRTNRI